RAPARALHRRCGDCQHIDRTEQSGHVHDQPSAAPRAHGAWAREGEYDPRASSSTGTGPQRGVAMRIAITGATGFIGRRLVRRLLDDGDEPVALTRDPEQARAALPVRCDVASWNPAHGVV